MQPQENERYEQPKTSSESAPLYEHCLRAIDRSLQFGPHGLPLMGCGDWNDGMNKVGEGGTGESVWVGWFLLVLLNDFIPLMLARQDHRKAQSYAETAAQLRRAEVARLGWRLVSPGLFRRWHATGFRDERRVPDRFPDPKLGRVRPGGSRPSPTRHASCRRSIGRSTGGATLLFTPPFDQGKLDPGYIKGYLPGIRENGGQYTHAATWMIQALAELGENQQAMSLFDLINPIRHTQTPADVAIYQTEPYAIAADVYSVPPNVGRGGWTWYTGSAAWLYRVVLEQLLGLQVTADGVMLEPHVPESWDEFEVTIRRNGSVQTIKATRKLGSLDCSAANSFHCVESTAASAPPSPTAAN